MKFIILLFVDLFLYSSVFAQEYKKLRVTSGLGISSGHGVILGGIEFIEPSYRVNDKFLVGFRWEGGLFGSSGDLGLYTSSSKSITGQYYFSNTHFFEDDERLFVGLGISSNSLSSGNDNPKLGIFPRVGYDLGHFTALFEVNFIQDFNILYSSSDPYAITKSYIHNFNISYLAAKIGYTIGGGKKKTI